MGVSPNPSGSSPLPAAVVSTVSPDVRIEEASEDGDDYRVFVEGTMFHDGLNKNAWGLTEAGAHEIADDLVGRDHVAAHPFVRGSRYDRSMTDGPGFPIGTVVETNVVSVDEAMVDGGEYTAEYVSEITDPVYKARYRSGQYSGDNYSVSIGIYGDPEAATCSICESAMSGDDCSHDRFDEVEVESEDGETETKIAGPLYDNGESDHLASVYMPAYEGATAEVNATASATMAQGGLESASVDTGGDVPLAASVLAEPHDASNPDPADTDDVDDDGYRVRVADRSTGKRDSFSVRLNHD